jgi:dephospho-CoA kinase
MLKIGITGGIGSGKSTICRLFEKLGIPVYYADDRAKWILQHDPVVKKKLIKLLGAEAFFSDGGLNRGYLAGKVFENRPLLQQLNDLVHPAIAIDSKKWFEEQANEGVRYALKEAALIFESGANKALDKVILITAPEKIRIKRVIERDQVTHESVIKRMQNQLTDEEKVKQADYVIENIRWENINTQVDEIHQSLIYEATRRP